MAFEISVGPAQLTTNIGEVVLISETDGQIHHGSERGFYFRDTRLVSEWLLVGNGVHWTLLNSAATAHFAAQVVLTNPDMPTDDGPPVKEGTLSLTIGRLLGLGGMRESFALCNHNRHPVTVTLEVAIRCDFSDIFDVKSKRRIVRGRTDTTWDPEAAVLQLVHTNDTFRRGVLIRVATNQDRPGYDAGALRFTVTVAPQGRWTSDLVYQIIDGDTILAAPRHGFAALKDSEQQAKLDEWRAQAVWLHTSHSGLQKFYEQSLDDLAALRLPIAGTNQDSFVPAAGIPWFAALFGRDSLITAMQTIPVYPDFARGALDTLARYQADGRDDHRDMQPDKIMHELRHGELAQLGMIPYTPYYGTADATPLYIILLHRAWRYSGDDRLIRQHRETLERCLAWIDHDGDLDGDGFQEYQRRSSKGAENQSWKDSGNAILDEEGNDVPAPKALCELQGYVYAAWRDMATMLDAIGEAPQAERLRAKAAALFERFNAVFWDEREQAYALCLDAAKRRVMTRASNVGHLLWSGIVPEERAAKVVETLLAPDMWSGWGVRTMSADHPAYNPHDYQIGSVWPHDNGIIAVGFKQYGFHKEAAQIAHGLVQAADRFLLHRLPEVFAGVDRELSPFPVQYLGANVPQAWASGSVFHLLHALLGVATDPQRGILFVDPYLPEWLPDLTLHGIRVGSRKVDLIARRTADGTDVRLDKADGVRLVRQPLRQSLGLGRI